jgi:hypothetical protein
MIPEGPGFRSSIGLGLMGLALAACASAAPEREQQAQAGSVAFEPATGSASAPAAASAKGAGPAIGAPCTFSDGWHPPPLPDAAPAAGATEFDLPAAPPGYSDRAPTGVGYCLTPDPYHYPYGYFTAKCYTDADCPSGSFCNDANPACPKASDCYGLCRRLCKADSECASPMTCSGGQAPRNYCSAPTDVRF